MRKVIILVFAVIACIVSVGAVRKEPHQEEIDFAGQGFVKMSATAYCVGHHTANGDAVYEGGCACSPDHIGDVAIIYTLEGEFLGYYFCNDTGGEKVRSGKIIDIYKTDYDRCKEFMRKIGKEQMVFVKWVHGQG